MDLVQPAKTAVNSVLRKFGYYMTKVSEAEESAAPAEESPANHNVPEDFDDFDRRLWESAAPFTMTWPEGVYSLRRAVEYVIQHEIPGDFVECGTWKGGSSMVMAMTLMNLGDTSRDLYLYDTFEGGWPAGGEHDIRSDGVTAHELWLQAVANNETPDTLFAKANSVRELMAATGYPEGKIHLVKGKVEDTIPGTAPEHIGLLRVDTDWYDSYLHILTHFYPRVPQRGVLMLDDYTSFLGAKKATDEYFEQNKVAMLLHRVDCTGYRIGVKT